MDVMPPVVETCCQTQPDGENEPASDCCYRYYNWIKVKRIMVGWYRPRFIVSSSVAAPSTWPLTSPIPPPTVAVYWTLMRPCDHVQIPSLSMWVISSSCSARQLSLFVMFSNAIRPCLWIKEAEPGAKTPNIYCSLASAIGGRAVSARIRLVVPRGPLLHFSHPVSVGEEKYPTAAKYLLKLLRLIRHWRSHSENSSSASKMDPTLLTW